MSELKIFGIWFKDPAAFREVHAVLGDSLGFPVEWAPMDLFGDRQTCDSALHLGNLTLELIAKCEEVDTEMEAAYRYDWVIFNAEDLATAEQETQSAGLTNGEPYAFTIQSGDEGVTIGHQYNFDRLTELTNVNVGMWEYTPAGYSFAERAISGQSREELRTKLSDELSRTPLGVVEVKEIHLSLSPEAVNEWSKLLGSPTSNRWNLEEGPVLSYQESIASSVDAFTIRVEDLESAEAFLRSQRLLSSTNAGVAIDEPSLYGVRIVLEE